MLPGSQVIYGHALPTTSRMTYALWQDGCTLPPHWSPTCIAIIGIFQLLLSNTCVYVSKKIVIDIIIIMINNNNIIMDSAFSACIRQVNMKR